MQVTNYGRALSSIGLQVNISLWTSSVYLYTHINDLQDLGGVAGSLGGPAEEKKGRHVMTIPLRTVEL